MVVEVELWLPVLVGSSLYLSVKLVSPLFALIESFLWQSSQPFCPTSAFSTMKVPNSTQYSVYQAQPLSSSISDLLTCTLRGGFWGPLGRRHQYFSQNPAPFSGWVFLGLQSRLGPVQSPVRPPSSCTAGLLIWAGREDHFPPFASLQSAVTGCGSGWAGRASHSSCSRWLASAWLMHPQRSFCTSQSRLPRSSSEWWSTCFSAPASDLPLRFLS